MMTARDYLNRTILSHLRGGPSWRPMILPAMRKAEPEPQSQRTASERSSG